MFARLSRQDWTTWGAERGLFDREAGRHRGLCPLPLEGTFRNKLGGT